MNDNNNIMGPSSSPDTSELTAALAAAQAKYPRVPLDSTNPAYRAKYASYASCCESLRGPLTEQGLSIPDFRPGVCQGQWYVVGTLRHKSGQWISGIAPLLMQKSDMQQFGSAMTYAKRTLLLSLTGGFVGEPDDDGDSLSSAPDDPKALAFEQAAKTRIAGANDAGEARKHLQRVELTVREKRWPAALLQRCRATYEEKWGTKEGEK